MLEKGVLSMRTVQGHTHELNVEDIAEEECGHAETYVTGPL